MTENEKLNARYREACRKETKINLNNMINNFIDNDNIDKSYKDNIISLIVGLLGLKQS